LRAFRPRHPVQTGIALIFGLIAVLATATAAKLGSASPDRNHPLTWHETAWNLPLDNWGQGRVWQASGPNGDELHLFARTKTGFCNCFNGIADDTEIDRIGDVDLHGDNFTPSAPGQATSLGELNGRKRLFAASQRFSGTRHVLSIVAATDCKAVVATLVSDQAISPAIEASAVAVLTGETFRRWADNQ
jgi:hypothetical protein